MIRSADAFEEDGREVALAGVGQDDDDGFAGEGIFVRQAQGGGGGRAAGDADQQAFFRRQPPRATGLLIGLLLVLIAECIGRGLFYGLHMTVGMAVAG